jgi:hypothetical protein
VGDITHLFRDRVGQVNQWQEGIKHLRGAQRIEEIGFSDMVMQAMLGEGKRMTATAQPQLETGGLVGASALTYWGPEVNETRVFKASGSVILMITRDLIAKAGSFPCHYRSADKQTTLVNATITSSHLVVALACRLPQPHHELRLPLPSGCTCAFLGQKPNLQQGSHSPCMALQVS